MLTTNRVTAVFDSMSQAEQAVNALRQLGLRDDHLSILSRHNDGSTGAGSAAAAADHGDDAAKGAGTGLVAGAGVGALFGLAAALIPGVGPFITAGWLASSLGVAAGGAAAGAIVGGTTGAVAGALARAGYSEHEANYYGSAVESGNIVVAVDTTNSGFTNDQISGLLSQHGGRFAGAGA